MPSGKMDEGYSRRLATLDLAGLYEQGLGKPLIQHLKQALANSGLYDYIFVDSRTGHSDEEGICTRDLADHLMIVTGFNRQNISGTALFLANLRATLTEERRKTKLKPDIILSPVPIGEEDRLSDREDCAAREFKEKWGESVTLNLFIPYHPRLALTEEAYVSTSTASYLGVAYQQIEERLLTSLGHLPYTLFGRIKDAIISGDGRQALVSFQRLVKIRRSFLSATPHSPRIRGNWSYMLPLSHDEELLKCLLKLPEASEILALYADAHPSPHELVEIGRRLHEQKSLLAGNFDTILLNLEIRDYNIMGQYAVYLHNKKSSAVEPSVVEAFYKAAIKADPKNSTNLGNYTVFLHNIIKQPDSAELYYNQALDANPKNTHNLKNFASFFRYSRKNLEAALNVYERADIAHPNDASILGEYAKFLESVGERRKAVESLYERAIKADPKQSKNLRNFADFYKSIGKLDNAENYYRRAVESDPNALGEMRSFAGFLWKIRKKSYAANDIFLKAIKADPNDALSLGDYGQFQIGNGKINEGLENLRRGWYFLDDKTDGNAAEFCYSIWLGTLLLDSPEGTWEGVFKFLIEKGFSRHQWDFDAMLALAKDKLSPNLYKYAKALADAFLDEANVAKLEKLPRWKKVEPIDSYLISADGKITEL